MSIFHQHFNQVVFDMNELENKIKKILHETLSTGIKTYYPTKEDMKRSLYMKPGGEPIVIGIDKAVNKIMKIIKEYYGE